MMERQILDWRFVAAFAFMTLVLVASWGFVHRQHQVDGLIVVSQRTTAQVQRLSDQLDALKAQAAEDASASLQQRNSLRKQNHQLAAQLQALLDYLTAHGIVVPNLKVATSSGGGGSPKGRGHHQPRPHHPAPATPGATPAPTAPSADPLCDFLPVACLLT